MTHTPSSSPPGDGSRHPPPFSELLHQRCAAAGITQATAARLAGISPSLLSRALSGTRKLPPAKAVALADVLRLPRVDVLRALRSPSSTLAPNPSNVLLRRRLLPTELKVFTDPHFIDSALFWWIHHNQPLISANVTCQLQQLPWGTVPQMVADDHLAIGFYNKQVLTRADPNPTFKLQSYADLTFYKGYALIGRNSESQPIAPPLDIHAARKLLTTGKKPTIVTMTGDPKHRLLTPLTTDMDFHWHAFPSADMALRRFQDGEGDYYIGGLPQRLFLKSDPRYLEVLHFGNNPFMASINSLFCSHKLATEHPDLLAATLCTWFDTVRRMHEDAPYRRAVAADIIKLLDTDQHNLTLGLFDEVFQDNEYEIFSTRPGDLLGPVLDAVQRAIECLSVKDLLHSKKPNPKLQEAFVHFRRALLGELPPTVD